MDLLGLLLWVGEVVEGWSGSGAGRFGDFV